MELKDSSLFHQQCYVDGAWADADSGETDTGQQSRDGRDLGIDPENGVRLKQSAPSRRPMPHCRPGGPRPPRNAP